jgi:hypothetical protein
MSNRYYNLTDPPNKGVADKTPDWMNSFFDKISSNEDTKKNTDPFSGIKDPILNPLNQGIEKKSRSCSICGKPLASNEVDICSNCI